MIPKRMQSMRRILADKGCDGMILCGGGGIVYLLEMPAVWWQRSHDIDLPGAADPGQYAQNIPDNILYIPAEGVDSEPVLVCTPQRAPDYAGCPIAVEVSYIHNAYYALDKYIRGSRIALGAICERFARSLLSARGGGLTFVPGEPLVNQMRSVKDDGEIAVMRRVAAMTDEVMQNVIPMLRPGVTRREIETYMINAAVERGMADQSFPSAALPFKQGAGFGYYGPNTPIEPATSVAFDFGYMLDGYCSDFGRSFYIGRAPEIVRRHYHALQHGVQALIEGIRPNVTNINEMFGMLWDAMEREGCVKYLRNFGGIGTLGHQIGLEVHENPWLSNEVDYVLRPGMIMCVEPKVAIPGECYLRVEDMLLITETGAESLTRFDRELFELCV